MMLQASATEIVLEAGGLRWGGLEWGPADAAPVVALHGWLDNAASFSGLGPLLAEKGIRLVALDLPGHAKTVPVGGALGLQRTDSFRVPIHFVDYIAPLHAVLAVISPVAPVSLLGHSMGAGIAIMYAGTFPERVKELALIEGLGPITEAEPEGPARLRKHVEALLALGKKTPPSYKQLDEVVQKRAQAGGLAVESARVLMERAMEGKSGGWSWRTDPLLRLPSASRLTETQVYAFLDQVRCPIHLFMAEKGFPHDLAQARDRLARLRKVRLERVQGGHHVHLDSPGTVAPSLIKFLLG